MVQCKRRHCDNLRSREVIDCVASLVPPHWRVDLADPDVVVWVEICSTLAGLSIVPARAARGAFHFNLLRARTAPLASSSSSSTEKKP
jgi:tRNA(Ser,Leu) C12 N-acetylase TAN1